MVSQKGSVQMKTIINAVNFFINFFQSFFFSFGYFWYNRYSDAQELI